MKKLLTLLNRAKATAMLLAALFTVNVVSAATGTETNPTTNDAQEAIVGKCYTIPATHNPAGTGAVGSLGKGLKLRTGNDGNRLVFNVNEGYTITKFVLDGVANDEGSISTVKVEVDDVETKFEGGGTFTKNDAVNITINNIKATKSIAIYFDNGDVVKNKQIYAVYSIDWETADGDETNNWFGLIQAIDASAKTLGAATFTGIEHVTNSGNLMGSQVNNYTASGANQTVYIENVAYTSASKWRKNINTSINPVVYDENQWLGYNLTIEQGHMLTITGVHAQIAIADDIEYKWKVVILDANGKELYSSKDNTTKKATGDDFVDKNTQEKLTNLTGTISVRLYVAQAGTTKNFAVPYLAVTGTVEEDLRSTYTVTTSVTPANSGTLTPETGSTFVEGSDVVFTATPATGYKFSKLTVDGQVVSGSSYTLESISKDITATAEFEALPKITYVLGDGVEGTAPAVNYAEAGTQITLPAAMLVYNPGKTHTGWNDGNTTYNVGEKATINGDVTFTAVFEDNQATLGDAETTVNWILGRDNGAPDLNFEGKTGAYTQKATINGEAIGVAMLIDTTADTYNEIFGKPEDGSSPKGKVNNMSQTVCAQVNKGTKLTIPAIKGMVVTIKPNQASKATVTSYTFDGKNADEKTSDNLLKYTYDGDKETIDLIDQGDNIYPEEIKVVYPVVEKKSVTTNITEAQYATFYAEFDATIPEDVTAYGATLNEEKNAIVLTAIEGKVIPAETAVILHSETAGDYTFTEAEEAASEVVNSILTGTAVETSISENDYVLGNGSKGVGFYHLTSGVKLGANQAYLPASTLTANGARVTFIGFGDNTATGIDTVAAPASAGKAYNLNGVQAAPNAKGVVIMDGKKVVIK